MISNMGLKTESGVLMVFYNPDGDVKSACYRFGTPIALYKTHQTIACE
jgi:hypothetical protein